MIHLKWSFRLKSSDFETDSLTISNLKQRKELREHNFIQKKYNKW